MNKMYSYLNIFLILGIILLPEIALAGNTQTQNFQRFVTEGVFKNVIDLGLLFLAAFQWFLYWNSFSPEKAFKDIIVPAVITFLAFNWVWMLEIVGLV